MSKCVSQDFLLYGIKLRSVGYSKYCLSIKKKKEKKEKKSCHLATTYVIYTVVT